MYVVQFPSLKFVEYPHVGAFQARVGPWLTRREAENASMLGSLPGLAAFQTPAAGASGSRFFAVHDREEIVAAAVLFGGRTLVVTWATVELIEELVKGLLQVRATFDNVYAPGYTSWHVSQLWAQRTGQHYEFDREERLYQLSRPQFDLPASGKLELATAAEESVVRLWLREFNREAEYELTGTPDQQYHDLVDSRSLYLWKNPGPVSMASWVCPTPHGGCINFVYTPPEQRGKGNAKAVVTALGRKMLGEGKRFCFILTDRDDPRTNNLYQKLGARTMCEFARCRIVAKRNASLAPRRRR
jgi:hypothetical protein